MLDDTDLAVHDTAVQRCIASRAGKAAAGVANCQVFVVLYQTSVDPQT
jgi:hypothetical protein